MSLVVVLPFMVTLICFVGELGAFSSEEGIPKIIYEKVDEVPHNIKVYKIKDISLGFTSKRGRIGDPIVAESGERLELMWTGLFPRYELLYFRNEDDRQPRRIGRCDFRHGCNECKLYAWDLNGDDVPDRFLRVEWISRDKCEKDDLYPKRERIYVFTPHFDALFVCETGICSLEHKDSSLNPSSEDSGPFICNIP